MAAPFQTYDYSFMSCKLIVDMNQPKWQKTLRKVLDCIQVYNFNMDEDGTVAVSGMTNPYVLLNRIGKIGKRVELVWLQSGECCSCLNMPSSTINVPVPPPGRSADDFNREDPYNPDDYNYTRGDDRYHPFRDYHGGGEIGAHYGGCGYMGWGGYAGFPWPSPSHGPIGEWAQLLQPFLSPSQGWI